MTDMDTRMAPTTQDRRRYLTASGVALWGAQIGAVGLPLTAVTTLDAGAGGTALLNTVLTLPMVLLGLPVGAWLDRVRRRPVMVAADLGRAVALITVPVAAWLEALTMEHLLAVVLVQGIGTVFFDLGTQSYVKDIAPGGSLARTNARLATLMQSALIAGPPLAGWAAGLFTAPTVLLVMAAGYLWSGLWLLRITAREHDDRHPRRHVAREMLDGLGFVARQPVLRTVLLAGSMVNIGTFAVVTLLPVLTLTHLGWTEAQLGLFLGAGGAGGLVGALAALWLSERLGAGRASMIVGIAVGPLALTLPLLGRPVPAWLAALGWALVILKVGFDSVLMMTFRQQVTPSPMLARVNATMRVVFTGASALGASGAGVLGTVAGLRPALGAAAVVLALVWVPIAFSPVRRMTILTEP